MKTNQSVIHEIALKLAEQDAKAFKSEATARAEHFVIGKSINQNRIKQVVADPLQVEQIIRSRVKKLKKQLRDTIKQKAMELMSKRVEELSIQNEKQMMAEINDFENSIYSYEQRERLVTVRNVVLVHRMVDGEPVGDYQKQLTMTVKEFNELVQQGKLVGYKGNGVVFGLLEAEDYTAEDFAAEGKIEADCGNGITALLFYDQWVDMLTRYRGNSERLKFINNSELKFGRAQEGFDSEREEEPEVEADTYADVDYSSRSREEQIYWLDLYEAAMNRCKSHKELYEAVAGVLFPTKEGKWVRPLNSISADARKKLLSLYHAKVDAVKASRATLLEQIIEHRKSKPLSFSLLINSLTDQQAREVLKEASGRKKQTGEVSLDLDTWKVLNKRAA